MYVFIYKEETNMKEKKISWLDKPWTWRGYLKTCGIVYGICIPIYVWYLFKIGILDWDEIKDQVKKKFKPDEE